MVFVWCYLSDPVVGWQHFLGYSNSTLDRENVDLPFEDKIILPTAVVFNGNAGFCVSLCKQLTHLESFDFKLLVA